MDILDIAIAKQLAGGGGGSGTDNYNDLSNLPKINDVTLSGNKSSSALGLQSEITSENKLDSDLIDDTNQDNKFVTSTEKNTWNAKQNAIDADHKLNADYVDDSTSTNKFVTASDKEAWNAKQNAIDNSHKLSSDLVDDANHTNKFVTSTEKNTWNGKQNAIDSDHKLSSSLVSFTTAEAAALASGIDSAKVAQIGTNQSNILSVEDMVCATEFSSSTAYAVGDMVTYEHKLYKFINAHQGAWSASDVQNYDLTRLEAEDRASLAEVVDSGAKNLLDFANLTLQGSSNVTVNKTDTQVTVTTNNNTWGHAAYKMTLPAGTYYYSCKISNLTVASGTRACIALDSGSDGHGTRLATFDVSTGTVSFPFIWTGGTLYIFYYPGYANTANNNAFTAAENMICTKAAFGVSQKFVAYRPDYDTLIKQSTYTTSTKNTSITNLLYDAAKAVGISNPAADTKSFFVSIFTETLNECLFLYGVYKHGAIGYAVSTANKGITFSAINNLGTISWTGGTSPYHVQVRFF